MANIEILNLPVALSIDGSEYTPIVQGDTTKRVATQLIANLAPDVNTKLPSYTVATLPSAVTLGAGAVAFVTDASTTLILGLGIAVVGGGSNKVPVYSDGSDWIIG